MSFGRVPVTPGVPPGQVMIWYNAALQCVIQLAQDLIQLALEGKYHAFDWEGVWPKKASAPGGCVGRSVGAGV